MVFPQRAEGLPPAYHTAGDDLPGRSPRVCFPVESTLIPTSSSTAQGSSPCGPPHVRRDVSPLYYPRPASRPIAYRVSFYWASVQSVLSLPRSMTREFLPRGPDASTVRTATYRYGPLNSIPRTRGCRARARGHGRGGRFRFAHATNRENVFSGFFPLNAHPMHPRYFLSNNCTNAGPAL